MNAKFSLKRYHHDLERIVSQAATHLHNALGKVGTALVRQDNTVVFCHNALDYADLPTLARFVASCLINQQDQNIQRNNVKDFKVFAMALDAEYAFLVIGECPDEKVVTDFLCNLRRVLPGKSHYSASDKR